VGGVSLRSPAEDGIVCLECAVYVAENCTFRRIGLDADSELWHQSPPFQFQPFQEQEAHEGGRGGGGGGGGEATDSKGIEAEAAAVQEDEARAEGTTGAKRGSSAALGEEKEEEERGSRMQDRVDEEDERGGGVSRSGGGAPAGDVLFGSSVGFGVVVSGEAASRISFCVFEETGVGVAIGGGGLCILMCVRERVWMWMWVWVGGCVGVFRAQADGCFRAAAACRMRRYPHAGSADIRARPHTLVASYTSSVRPQ
jgi:hypothetical protein